MVMAMSIGKQWTSARPTWRSLNHQCQKLLRPHQTAHLERIGQSFDQYYEYHYSAMPMESPPANPKVRTGAREVDIEVQPEIVRDVQMMESTHNGRTRPNGALGGQVEKGTDDHHTRACTRIRSQPDLSAYLICSSCETRGHFIADCPMTNVTRAVPISVVPPTSPA
ncbi:unnamed protein product, partial [Brassica rapa]